MEYIIRYEKAKTSYERSLSVYSRILSRKEELFQRTQPKGIAIDPDRVQGSGDGNPLEEYMIRKEKLGLDQKLTEAWSIVESRTLLMERAEANLRMSKGVYDKIYTARYLDGIPVHTIARRLHYSESNVYRILSIIDRKKKHKK